MYRLGQLFRAGKGVPSSQVRAHLYFSLAATRGKSRAAAERDELAATMSAEELARAEELVERLNPLVTDDKELVALAATTAVDEADTTVAIPLRSTPIGGNSVADVDAGPTDAPVAAAAPEVLTVGGWTSTNANGQSENLSDSGISVTGTYNPSTGVVDTELSLGGDTVAVTFDANGAVSVTRGGETFETDLPIVSVFDPIAGTVTVTNTVTGAVDVLDIDIPSVEVDTGAGADFDIPEVN